jgi:hypothetical protein
VLLDGSDNRPARHGQCPLTIESLKLVGDPIIFLHSDRVHYAQVKYMLYDVCRLRLRGLNAYKDWHHKFLSRLASSPQSETISLFILCADTYIFSDH